jgi:hypothetical protein
MSRIIINRQWAMPNKNTFTIKPVYEIIAKYISGESIDPFANSNPIARITNDIDNQYDTDYNMDAIEFLNLFRDLSVDTVLFDPPYSPRQVSESYKKMNMSVNMQTTQSAFWSKLKKDISRITKRGGCVISCGWNSGGIGKSLGFQIEEILLVPHGGWHNDTIITVERKVSLI